MEIQERRGHGIVAKRMTLSIQELIMLKSRWRELMAKAEIIETAISNSKGAHKVRPQMEDLAIDLTDFDIFMSKLTVDIESETNVHDNLFGSERITSEEVKELTRIEINA